MTDITGRRIRQIRRQYNKTQEEMGKIVGCSRASIAQYERGHYQPSTEVLGKLATYFNVSTDYLTGVIDTPTPLRIIEPIKFESQSRDVYEVISRLINDLTITEKEMFLRGNVVNTTTRECIISGLNYVLYVADRTNKKK